MRVSVQWEGKGCGGARYPPRPTANAQSACGKARPSKQQLTVHEKIISTHPGLAHHLIA